MSDDVDLRKEFLAGFVAEAEEHLSASNAALTALEKATSAGRVDPPSSRNLFRRLHTLKGLAAMVDVQPVVELSHAMEDLVRRSEQVGGRFSHAAIDLLVQGLRGLESRIHAVGAGEPPAPVTEPTLRAFEQVELEGLEGASEPAFALEPEILDKLGPAERQQIAQGIGAGLRALRVDFVPSPERAARGVVITSVRARVEAIAEIVKVIPLSRAETPSGLAFAMLVLTSASDEELADAAASEPEAVRPLVGERPPPIAMEEMEASVEELGGRSGFVRVDVRRLDEAMERLGALVVTRFRIARAVDALAGKGVDVRELASILGENHRQLRDLRASIVRVRMVPVAEVLSRVPLIVRGLTRATGKKVDLRIDAGGAELDKAVADRIFPAVVQLVRNAVDHAIQSPEARRAAGKPEQGRIRVASREGEHNRLELLVEDDGAGVDVEAVAARAGAPVSPDPAALLDLLTRPGFTTREHATTTSGRGLGLDIVRRIAEDDLGGEMRLETEPGRGSRFVLAVPLSITIVDVFSFSCAGERFVVPVAGVDELIEVERDRLVEGPAARDGGIRMLRARGGALPLLDLAQLMGLTADGAERPKAMVVRTGAERLAFQVDRMLGQQEVVVRPVDDPLVKVPGVAGTTDLGDGRATLVLDLFALGARVGARRESAS